MALYACQGLAVGRWCGSAALAAVQRCSRARRQGANDLHPLRSTAGTSGANRTGALPAGVQPKRCGRHGKLILELQPEGRER